MKIALLIILSSPILNSSHANIRVGGTGGGLAEMKAYSVVEQLPKLLNLCVSSAQQCRMNDWQKSEVLKLSRILNLNHIELVAPWNGPSKLQGHSLKLNSQDLYASGRPNKFGEILSFVLFILLRDGLNQDITLAKWPYSIFSNLQENLISLQISNYGFILHRISLDSSRASDPIIQALALEKEKVTQDLTTLLHKEMGCENPVWQMQNWNYVYAQSWVRGQIGWNCNRQEWFGELQLILNSNGVSKLSIVRRTRVR